MTATLVFALGASAAAAIGWTSASGGRAALPSIRIVDVRPLQTSDANLRDLITHTFKVRVAISGWSLLTYAAGARRSNKRAGAGHWRLYLDGRSLGDTYGKTTVTYTPYLVPGEHWVAAELTNGDGTSLEPPVWSEPVILHVPRTIRCWQTGWRGSDRGTPTFTCAGKPAL